MRSKHLITWIVFCAVGWGSWAAGQIPPYQIFDRINRGRITGIAYAPDGKSLAVATRIGTWLYNASTFKPTDLIEEGSSVEGIVFSPDGKMIAEHIDHEVHLWDVEKHQVTRSFLSNVEKVKAISFSPDSKVLALGNQESSVVLLNVESGDTVSVIRSPHPVISVAFSPDGRLLATGDGGQSSTVRLWDIGQQREVGTLEGGSSFYLQFSPSGELLAAVGGEDVHVWDVVEKRQVGILAAKPCDGFSFSPDGKWVATSSGDNTVRLWDMQTLSVADTFAVNFKRSLSPVTFSPDGGRMAVWGDDDFYGAGAKVYVWDVKRHQEVAVVAHDNNAKVLEDISPNGQLLAIHDDVPKAQIEIWDISRRQVVTVLVGHADKVVAARFSPDNRTLVSASEDKTIRVWDMVSGTETSQIAVDVGSIWHIRKVVLSPDGRTAAILEWINPIDPSANNYPNPRVDVYDLTTHQRVIQTSESNAYLATPVFSPDSRMVIMQEDLGSVLFDVASRTKLGELKGIYGHYAFSPDGKLLATLNQSRVSLWDVGQLKEIGLLSGSYPLIDFGGFAFSPDGKLLAAFGYHQDSGQATVGDSRIWDLATRQEIARLEEPAFGGRFSPDGQFLAIQGLKAVYLWDVARREQVSELKFREGPVTKMFFSGDGRFLVAGGEGGTVSIWEAAVSATAVEESAADELHSSLPKETALLPAFPNPFNSGVSIPFVLAKDSAVRIGIYNLAGQEVRAFDLGNVVAGSYAAPGHSLWWDGRNATGEECATGVYLCRIQAETASAVRRLLLVK